MPHFCESAASVTFNPCSSLMKRKRLPLRHVRRWWKQTCTTVMSSFWNGWKKASGDTSHDRTPSWRVGMESTRCGAQRGGKRTFNYHNLLGKRQKRNMLRQFGMSSASRREAFSRSAEHNLLSDDLWILCCTAACVRFMVMRRVACVTASSHAIHLPS